MKTSIPGLLITLILFGAFSCKKEFSAVENLTHTNDAAGSYAVNGPLPVVIVTGTDTMQAHNLYDGTESWRMAAPRDKFTNGPVIFGNSMYFTTTHTLFKAHMNNQQVIWQRDIPAGNAWPGKIQPLALCENYVIAVFTVPDPGSQTTTGKVIAIDTATGNTVWVREFVLPGDSARATAPAVLAYYPGVGQSKIYAGMGRRLVAINASDGAIVFNRTITSGGNGIFHPCVRWNYIVTGSTKNVADSVYLLSARDGHILQSRSLGDGFCGKRYPFLVVPVYHTGWYEWPNEGIYINGRSTIFVADVLYGGLEKGKMVHYQEITNPKDCIKPLWITKQSEIPEYTIRMAVNLDGSKYAGWEYFSPLRRSDFSQISFATPVGDFAYPNVDDWPDYMVYSYWGTNFAVGRSPGSNEWQQQTSNIILNFVIINIYGTVMYSADSGMMN